MTIWTPLDWRTATPAPRSRFETSDWLMAEILHAMRNRLVSTPSGIVLTDAEPRDCAEEETDDPREDAREVSMT